MRNKEEIDPLLETTVNKLEDCFAKETDIATQLEIANALLACDSNLAVRFLQQYIFEVTSIVRKRLIEILTLQSKKIDYELLQNDYLEKVSDVSVTTRRDITWLVSITKPAKSMGI